MTNSMLDVYEALQQREAHNREVVQQLEAVTRQLADELAVNAALRERLEAENALLQQRLAQQRPAVTVVGEDGDLAPLMQQVRRAAQSPFAVLLTGESGTGKEVIAQYIHQVSPRHNKPFITVNCAALPEALIESELFGHEKGAFTGATERKLGKFVLADGGTIFLDEIGDLPLAVQPKLLRVLENGCVDRLGAGKPVPVDVRVVAATNRKLEEAVAAGTFRADLYYRLKVLHLHLPPLRQRPRDLAVLAELFLAQTAQEMGIRPPVLSPAALACLRRHPWPGNVRQLRHVLAAALCQHPVAVLEPSHLEPLLAGDEAMSHSTESRLATGPEEWEGDWATLMAMQERRVLEALLAQCRTQKEMAARLKVSEARIHRLLKKHQLLGWKAQQRNGHVPS
ncbi:MAG: hypothetical protein KatS3mg131_0941 [Candidatus Tectimicrobiota bacterium]|nr:MAG: hypothetical protein KatS3mg131_0941 [Candidatus Tectomicrobia bacterium]